MSQLIWGIIALVILLLLTLIAMGMRTVSSNKMSLGVSNLFADGLLFGLFAILFAPLYLSWMGARSVWIRLRPPAPLPVEGDEPIWGRTLNREIAKTVFLAVQQARMNHNVNHARKLMVADLYKRLKRECDQTAANRKTQQRQERKNVEIKSIVLSDERIDKQDGFCYLNATVTGTTTSEAEAPPEDFSEHLEFIRAPPSVKDAPWVLNKMSGL